MEGKLNRSIGLELSDARRDKMTRAEMNEILSLARETRDAKDGIIQTIERLADRLEEEKEDPEAVAEVVTLMRQTKTDLATAVLENTEFDPSGNRPAGKK
jgi:hypothetical protein